MNLSCCSSVDSLLKEAAFINGKWIYSTKTFDVFNPFDGKLIAKVPNLGEVECEEAIDAAYEVKTCESFYLKTNITIHKKLLQTIKDYTKSTSSLI